MSDTDGDTAPKLSSILPSELPTMERMRALAHPLRLRLLEELALVGSGTATELAERVGESPANCSWHLRQLAKAKVIEEAEGGTGRQRPWRVVPFSMSAHDPVDSDAPVIHAQDEMFRLWLAREFQALQEWIDRRSHMPRKWHKASAFTNSWGWMTAEELAALKADLYAVMDRHLASAPERVDPVQRPPGGAPIRIVAWAIPADAPPEAEPTDDQSPPE